MLGIPSVRRRAVVGVSVVLAAISCGDKHPTAPSIVTPRVVRIELQAPSEIAPDESVQLTVTAIKSDNSVENVTGRAIWSLSTPAVLQVTSSGLATGKSRGEVTVAAFFDGRSATARILVLPKGTFRLTGSIRERTVAIPGVTLTVVGGQGEGSTATSDANGNYALYGVGGAVTLQLRREGYFDSVQQVAVSSHRTADFEMTATRSRTEFQGNYTLTITASPNCRSLPGFATRREYNAAITQDGPLLKVVLTGGDFVVTVGRGNGFFGSVDVTDNVTFTIGDIYLYYDYYWANTFDIVERLETGTVLTAGRVITRATPALISGQLNGSIVVSESAAPPFGASAWCGSTSHRFEMVRR